MRVKSQLVKSTSVVWAPRGDSIVPLVLVLGIYHTYLRYQAERISKSVGWKGPQGKRVDTAIEGKAFKVAHILYTAVEDGPLVRERGEKAAGREERRPSQNDLAVRVSRNLVGGAKFGVRGAAEHGDDDVRRVAERHVALHADAVSYTHLTLPTILLV